MTHWFELFKGSRELILMKVALTNFKLTKYVSKDGFQICRNYYLQTVSAIFRWVKEWVTNKVFSNRRLLRLAEQKAFEQHATVILVEHSVLTENLSDQKRQT